MRPEPAALHVKLLDLGLERVLSMLQRLVERRAPVLPQWNAVQTHWGRCARSRAARATDLSATRRSRLRLSRNVCT